MLQVTSPKSRRGRHPVASVLHGEGVHDPFFPHLHVAPEIAESLLEGSGFTLEELQEKIDGEQRPHSVPLAANVIVDVHARYTREAPTENVLAVLRGTDPGLRDEYLLVGAHLDHVGGYSEEVFFPGAHDNASGAATVLAVAEAFARAKEKPRRSVVFALFASEEQGLFGARHLAENLPMPAEAVTAVINIDCVGRGESIQLGSGGAFPRLHQLAREIDTRGTGRVREGTWYGGGADATPFFEREIPTVYFHTPGGYDHLHSVYDTPDTLDPGLLADTARLVYAVAREIAVGAYEREPVAPRETATAR
jgi:Iap family predicted aminopeptidase